MAASGSRLLSSNRAGWSMAAPAFGLILLFIIVPFALAFGLSFTNQRLFSPNPTQWVGTANFKQLLGVGDADARAGARRQRRDQARRRRPADLSAAARLYPQQPRLSAPAGEAGVVQLRLGRQAATYVLASDVVFMKALRNTFLFVLVVAPLQGGLALVLALMINQKLRGINFFRAVYFMPVVVSIVVVSLLWRFIYDGNNGLLNNVLGWVTFGAFQPVDWLGNPSTALPAIIAMSIWQAVGFHMVIWLAGLQTIPPTLYEAANIEGATPLAGVPLRDLAGAAQHRGARAHRHHHAGLRALRADRRDDQGRAAQLDADHGLPGGRARLPQAGHRRRAR